MAVLPGDAAARMHHSECLVGTDGLGSSPSVLWELRCLLPAWQQNWLRNVLSCTLGNQDDSQRAE